MQNEAQYELDRKAAKISALFSNNLDKYEYLTGEKLGLKLNTIEQAKFEYSPLGKKNDKGLDKDKDKKEGLLKRLKDTEDKNKEHLKVFKDQLEKQPFISKVKNPNFNNVSFKNLLDDKSMEVFDEIKNQDEIIDYSQLNFIGSSKKYNFHFGDFLSLGSLAENTYNGNISLDTAKQKQRKMEDMLESFINYSLIKNMYKSKKIKCFLNAKEFYKGRRNIVIAFEDNTFPLPKPYVFGKNEWKEKGIPINETFMPKTIKLSFLENNNQNEFSEKENELLHRDFGYKNIDELIAAFNNIKTDGDFGELFEKIDNKLSTLKKLVKIVSNKTEKKRMNNVIKSIEFALDYVALDKNVSYSYNDGDNKQDIFDSEFSDTGGNGLRILTPNQMLSRLPITLAQLNAGNNSEKLKNEIRQLLYSLYRSKKLTKQLYKSLIDII